MPTLNTYIDNFLSIIYPNLCYVCNAMTPIKGKHICLHCLSEFPYTSYFEHAENTVTQKFYGRVEIENGVALISYYKGSVYADMIHRLKYEGVRKIGSILGEMAGRKLQQSVWANDIDAIIPVPISKIRRMKRGYNQSAEFAKGIHSVVNLPVIEDLLLKHKHTSSQVEKDRAHRLQNVMDSFSLVSPDRFIGKHLLIVDDVITTGATLEACITKLSNIRDVKISILAIGLVKR